MCVAASSASAGMSTELAALLQTNKVHADITKYLTDEGCLSMEQFANLLDNKNELKDEVFAHVSSITTKKGVELSNLKQAWREAEGIVARGLKRASEGIPEETLDEPLHVDAQKRIEAEFTRYYRFTLKPAKMGCDSLLGRLKREFDKHLVTIFPVTRVRSIAHVSRDLPQRKRRIAADVVVEFESTEDAHNDLKDMNRVFLLFNQLDVLATTWAVAGCYDTKAQDKDGQVLKYCH